MRILNTLLSSLVCLIMLPVAAQTSAVQLPLTPVPADSISVEDFFWYGQILNTQKLFPTLKAQAWSVPAKTTRQLPKLTAKWEEKLKALDLTGYVTTEAHKGPLQSAIRVVQESATLALATGQARYAGIMERALYNSICGVQHSPNSKDAHQAAQILVNTPGYAMATSGEHLFINMFIRSNAHICTPHLNFTLITISSVPWYDQMSFQFDIPNGTQHMTLHLKIPDWLDKNPLPGYEFSRYNPRYSISLNGKTIIPAIENGYLVIEKEWTNEDLLTLSLPNPIRRVYPRSHPEQVALQRGVLVYSYLNTPEQTYLRPADPIHSEFNKDRHTNQLSSKYYDAQGNQTGTYQSEPYPYQRYQPGVKLFLPKLP